MRYERHANRTTWRALLASGLTICLVALGAEAASAAPTWLGVSQLSVATNCPFLVQSPSIVSLADGSVVAAWERRDDGCGAPTHVEVSIRPAGGAFGAPVMLSGAAGEATDPKLAVDASGTVIAAWVEDGFIRYSQRAAGGSFAEAQTIAGAGPAAAAPDVAIAGGNAVVAWTRVVLPDRIAEVAVKDAGGPTFGAVTPFASVGENANDVDVAISGSGAALFSWQTVGQGAVLIDTLHAAARAPGGAFGELAPVFTTTADLDNIAAPRVAMDPSGRGTLLWSYRDSAASTDIVKSAARGTAGNFGGVQNASNPAVDSGFLGSIDLAVDSADNAIAVWWAGTMQAAVRPSGGSFGPVITNISAPNFVITPPSVGFDPSGRAVAVWLSPGGASFEVQSAILAKGASSFGPVAVARSVAGAGGDTLDGSTPIGVDDQGNAVTMWRRGFDISPAPGFQPGFAIEASLLDAVGPELRSLAIPAAGDLGVAVDVSVTPVDRLSSIASTIWTFGDGATASGTSASHAYTTGGPRLITVTATDAVGNATTASRTIQIPTKPTAASLAINGLRMSPSSFRAALKGAMVRAANLKPWSRVSYSVSFASKVRFSFERPRAGRRAGSRCVKPARSNRKGKSCIRYLPVKGSFTRSRPRGNDRFTYTGRLSGHRLPAGRYRLIVRATASGVSGAPKRVGFTIRKALKKKAARR
jgi:hypothetical protein